MFLQFWKLSSIRQDQQRVLLFTIRDQLKSKLKVVKSKPCQHVWSARNFLELLISVRKSTWTRLALTNILFVCHLISKHDGLWANKCKLAVGVHSQKKFTIISQLINAVRGYFENVNTNIQVFELVCSFALTVNFLTKPWVCGPFERCRRQTDKNGNPVTLNIKTPVKH